MFICLMGPTASGKTQLAFELVKHFPCEIISVDSAMIYRDMNIGTAKPTKAELELAPHRLINICDPSEIYSVGRFLEDVKSEINDIKQQNKIPLLVGGTMLYFNALKNGLADMPTASKEIRDTILNMASKEGWLFCHEELKKVDPLSASKIHPHDKQRLQRALELYYATGKTRSAWWLEQQDQDQASDHSNIWIAITPSDRKMLHQRIELRFDNMLSIGFLDEARTLFERGDLTSDMPSIKTVGYRQAFEYLSGACSYQEMRDKAIASTRQLAKRQMTWLRSFEGVHFYDSEAPDLLIKISALISKSCQQI